MANEGIWKLSARQLREKILSQTLSSVDVTKALIARIRQYDESTGINCVVVRNFDAALERAKQADTDIKAGKVWGPLHGVPMTVKESKDIVGLPTCKGVKENSVAQKNDAYVVTHILAAGAIIIGKTNVPVECLDWEAYNPVYGPTANPWDKTKSPGGSSGGAAAALAAGFTPLEIGSDVAGSIRVPASFCGVLGHQPSNGVIPYGSPTKFYREKEWAVSGPMARTAEDLEIAMYALSRRTDLAQDSQLLKAKHTKLSQYRVAIFPNHEKYPVQKIISTAMDKVQESLTAAGAEICHIGYPDGLDTDHSLSVYMRILGTFAPTTETLPYTGDDKVLYLWETGRRAPHSEFIMLCEDQQKIQNWWEDYFDKLGIDVLLAPVTVCTAFESQQCPNQTAYSLGRTVEIDGETRHYSDLFFWPHFSILGGLPSTAIPVPIKEAQTPVGIQIIGRRLHDLTTIHFAKVLLEQMHYSPSFPNW